MLERSISPKTAALVRWPWPSSSTATKSSARRSLYAFLSFFWKASHSVFTLVSNNAESGDWAALDLVSVAGPFVVACAIAKGARASTQQNQAQRNLMVRLLNEFRILPLQLG